MSTEDRRRWDARYADVAPDVAPGRGGRIEPPALLARAVDHLPTSGRALDVACGRGRGSVWLADRGLTVLGLDVSPVAIDLATDLADRHALGDRCRFEVADLDQGLPASATEGPPFDLVLCHLFRDPTLDRALIDRLAPGGVLAMAALSVVGHDDRGGDGRFRAAPGELLDALADLVPLADGEGDGHAWLVAASPATETK